MAKHRGQHVMYHQTGYRVVVHDLKTNERLREGPWTVVGTYEPVIFHHDDDDNEALETAAQEAAEQAAGTT